MPKYMTRAELLRRLKTMEEEGENMSVPVRVEIKREVQDRRTRSGLRTESMVVQLAYAASGTTSFREGPENVKGPFGMLIAFCVDGHFGEWH